MEIDQVVLQFNATGIKVLGAVLGLILFGVALDLKFEDFKQTILAPKAPLIGFFTQLIALPMLTFLFVQIWPLPPSLALGMLLVAACPGGNVSNYLTHVAGGTTSASVTLTAISTALTPITLPFLLSFWASFDPTLDAMMKQVELSTTDLATSLVVFLFLPLVAGLSLAHYSPNNAKRLQPVLSKISSVVFIAFVVIAFASNYKAFIICFPWVFVPVALLNGAALALGYYAAKLFSLPLGERKALSFEVGIQNTGLGLFIAFEFFDGLGGMAVATGWWGIWHLVSGGLLASYWRYKGRAE